ncbi:hypothetical protein GIB67_020548 [Kingdonia uniflora]|uniref:Pentatricopeptide repeat-containing protein n=1 Tax=Kingdonia uniflora TaxID=39325 RepID=A0A7J7NM07_9MAGN|nr:hypothetical protein GIB67_020548 [Kingdonia uniflora]
MDQDLDMFYNVFKKMNDHGCVADAIVYGTLITYEYCKNGDAATAMDLLDRNVDREDLAGFLTACYDTDMYSVVSNLSERISRGLVEEKNYPSFSIANICFNNQREDENQKSYGDCGDGYANDGWTNGGSGGRGQP